MIGPRLLSILTSASRCPSAIAELLVIYEVAKYVFCEQITVSFALLLLLIYY